jgi:hypothetical protein
MYLVYYTKGSYDDYTQINLFVTAKKPTATKYVTKFNRILKRWKKHYEQYQDKRLGINWIRDEYVDLGHFDRWYTITGINGCYYHEIEMR